MDAISQLSESDRLRVDLGDNVFATATMYARDGMGIVGVALIPHHHL